MKTAIAATFKVFSLKPRTLGSGCSYILKRYDPTEGQRELYQLI